MPAPSDLIGQRFGRLVVIAEGPRIAEGRRSWRTRCDCGTEETYPQRRLTQAGRRDAVRECAQCAAPKCVVCGAPVADERTARRVCSDTCADARDRRTWRRYYHTHAAEIADRRRGIAPDVNYAAKWQQRRAEEAADPSLARKRRADLRAHYARHRLRIQEARLAAMAERLAAMSDAELDAYNKAPGRPPPRGRAGLSRFGTTRKTNDGEPLP